MRFNIKLADLLIEIHPRYPTLKEFCKDYICKEEPSDAQIMVQITDREIEAEQEKAEEEYSPQYLETLATLRQIADQMPEYNRLLCHGAVITWKDKGYMFTAPSGTGKSTHIAQWRKYLGEDVQIVNGDKPLMKVTEEEIRLYGTPWAGKERWQKNRSTRLDGICILQQAKENTIRRLSSVEALPMLIRQLYFTDNTTYAGKTLELLDILLRNVPVYLLECDISREAVRCSFEALTGTPMPEEQEEKGQKEE